MLTPAKDLVNRAVYRPAIERDLAWINEHYEKLMFEKATFADQDLWIAESMGRPIGVGRVLKIDEDSGELGGIFVLDSFRKLGVSKSLIEHLLARAREKYRVIYCIPLNHLVEYYKKFGFENYSESLNLLPERLRSRLEGCGRSHDVKHLLWLRTA